MEGEGSEGGHLSPRDLIKDKRISDIGSEGIKGVSGKKLERLIEVEKGFGVAGYEGGLPLYLLESGESLRRLEAELGIDRKALARVFDFYGIPRPTQQEASAQVLERFRQDSGHMDRMRNSARDRLSVQRTDPNFRAKQSEGVRRGWENSPDRKLAVAEQSRRRWKDPEYKKRLSEKLREATTRSWQDPEIRQRILDAIKASKQVSPLDPETRKKISDAIAEAWTDPEYREMQVASRQRVSNDPEFKAQQLERLRRQLAAMRNDPEIMAKKAESLRRRWQDPEFRDRRVAGIREIAQDPDYRRKHLEALGRLWQDPEFRKKKSGEFRELLEDEEFQQRRLAGLSERWSDPEFRERVSEGSRQRMTMLNQDPDHQRKAAEGIRRLREQPESSARFYLPTMQGFRRDIGYHALSMWEANFARVLMYCGREFYPKESFLLEVPEEYRNLFSFDVTQFTTDFIVEDPRGNLGAYELIAHPFEDPVGYAKADMFAKQYPDINLHIVDQDMYSRLRDVFQKKIDASQELCGWETSADNLTTNPTKYS